MSSPDNISLLDIFNLYMGSDKVVVVKNISDDTARDTLESYLAVILNKDLIGVHYPADVSGCCVAVVNRAIRGLWKCHKALLKQPLDGNIIELYAVGQCDGLLIRNPHHQSSDGELEAYLRSDEFTGGAAGEIKEIKRFSCGSGRFAVVLISDVSVISRILNRPAQALKYNLDIDPYFSALHDALQIDNQPMQQALALQTQNQQETGKVEINQSQENALRSGGLGEPEKASIDSFSRHNRIYPTLIETSCIEYNQQLPSNYEINDCETFTERQALDEHHPITSRSPQLRTDEASAVIAHPRRLYKKAQELQCGLPEDEAYQLALIQSVSEINQKSENSVAPFNQRGEIIPVSLDAPVTQSQQDDSTRTSQLRIFLDEPASKLEVNQSQENALRSGGLSEPENASIDSFSRHNRIYPTLTDDIETSCIEYNQQLPSNYGINDCETLTERQALDEHQPITSCSPHLQSQLRTDEASAAIAHPRRLYKKAQELQHRLPEDEAYQLALIQSVSEINVTDQKFENRQEEDISDVEHQASLRGQDQQGQWGGLHELDRYTDTASGDNQFPLLAAESQTARRNKPHQLLQEFQSGKSEKEALREALERSITDASFKKSERHPRSRRRSKADHRTLQRSSSVDASDNKDRRIKSNATKQVQDSFTKQAAPPTSVKRYTRSSSEDRCPSSRSYNQTTTKPTTGDSYEKILQKRRNVSNEAKTKIRDTLRRLRVQSYEDPKTKTVILKGNEDNVKESYTQILQILLDDTQNTETRKAERISRKKEFRTKPEIVTEYMAMKHEPEVPEYWEKFQQGLISQAIESFKLFFKGRNYFKVKLSPSDPVYKDIIKLILNTWDEGKLFKALERGRDAAGLKHLGYKRMQVTKIQRIENLQLYEKYSRHRKRIFLTLHMKNKRNCHPIDKLPESWGQAGTQSFTYCNAFADEVFPQVNEHLFFHGTTESVVDIICDKGFDFRLGSQNAMYGAGIYGAESPTKADQYADSPDKRLKGNRKMFLMRMVLGESFLCTARDPKKYRRPPCANTKHLKDDCLEKSHGSFDSVIGQAKRLLFREFVVYDSDQCYPEYLISYDRV